MMFFASARAETNELVVYRNAGACSHTETSQLPRVAASAGLTSSNMPPLFNA